MLISRVSRQRFADLAARSGTVSLIDQWFQAEDFTHDEAFELPSGGVRRALIDAYESRIDWSDEAENHRVLRVYARAVEEVGDYLGERSREADLLIKSLVRDGTSVDADGNVVVPAFTHSADLPLTAYERLRDPSVLQAHLHRIEAGIRDDPEAGIGSSKELAESVCKIILEDYGVEYDRRDDVLDLYKKVARALRLSAESVPESARGSQAAQRALRALVTTIQSLAELRNELGLGHGRATKSPALRRHARLTFQATRAVAEFLLDTWHVRRETSS
jgi:Abortive infection C-terminus